MVRVSVHIQSRADFLTAMDAGADIIAHTPGMGYEARMGKEAFVITKEDAIQCAERKTSVITTLSFLKYLMDRGKYESIIKDEIILPNIRLLKQYHVRLVIGVDQFRQTGKDEALFISSLGLFSNLELLKLCCEATPGLIFPGRKIGRLSDGFEASFLALDGNPVVDFQNTTRISLWCKQGVLLGF